MFYDFVCLSKLDCSGETLGTLPRKADRFATIVEDEPIGKALFNESQLKATLAALVAEVVEMKSLTNMDMAQMNWTPYEQMTQVVELPDVESRVYARAVKETRSAHGLGICT